MPSSGSTTHRTPEVPGRSPPSSPRSPSDGRAPRRSSMIIASASRSMAETTSDGRALRVDDEVVRSLVAQEGPGAGGRTPGERQQLVGGEQVVERAGLDRLMGPSSRCSTRPIPSPCMLTTYRRALALPGAWQFSSTGFVARLPIAMIGLGIVLLISTTHRLVRPRRACCRRPSRSPRPAGRSSPAGGSTRSASIGSCRGSAPSMPSPSWPSWPPWSSACPSWSRPCGRGGGATQPAIGSMVRARWAAAAPDADRAAQRLRAREHHRRAHLHRRAADHGLPGLPAGAARSP